MFSKQIGDMGEFTSCWGPRTPGSEYIKISQSNFYLLLSLAVLYEMPV